VEIIALFPKPEKPVGALGAGREIALQFRGSAFTRLCEPLERAQGIAAESPQEAHERFRGLGAESPVFCEAKNARC
jgi:hypothetical protein